MVSAFSVDNNFTFIHDFGKKSIRNLFRKKFNTIITHNSIELFR